MTALPDVPADTLRFLVDSAPDGVAILVRGAIVFINPRGAQLLGAPSPAAVLGSPIATFMPPEDARLTGERIAHMFRTGEELPPNEYRVLAAPDRTVEIKSILCRWQDEPAVLAFARDVSERKLIQRKLVESDRLAALGTLAAGVAHEINNPLTYAQLSLQRVEQLLGRHPITGDVNEHLRNIEHGIARVAAIAQSLRTFARADDAPPGAVDLREILERALDMLDNQLRHDAIVERHLVEVPLVIGNASKLEQVFVNLLLNARHALTGDDRRIEVALTSQGDDIIATVRDSGVGIPAAIRDRVFEPFFTTRQVGEGMGLGLSVCKSIVETFGGSIEIESKEGAGTLARVTLRAHRGAAPTVPARPPVTTPARSRPRRRVLLVDDDPQVRMAVGIAIGQRHDVTSVDGGPAALAALAAGSFDVILCDVMMPVMSGRDVYQRIAQLYPGLERQIVFITGGTFSPELEGFLATCGNRCIMKPFKIDQILDAIP